jgi:AcrR family transcriptional regulator
MVVTPWGSSEELRSRRLPPGPATAPEAVAENQRGRLFAAMIASVSSRGYAATRVADLVEMSGVSTRSFYDLFDDKEACFLATVDAILVGGAELILASAEASPNRRAASIEHTAALLGVPPASARVCVVDACGAGRRVAARAREATGGLERLAAGVAARRWEDLPPELISAWVGGLLEMSRAHLIAGTEAELPGLFADFASIFSSYEPPVAPLRPTGRAPSPAAESLEGHDHADRAIRAFTAVLAERDYAEVSVEETLRRASMSATTFYAHFAGKDDVLMAAIDSAGAQAVAAASTAFRRYDDWGLAVRGAVGALFNFLAFRPHLARLLLVEFAAGGAEAMRRRAEALRPLAHILDGAPSLPGRAPVVREVMLACVLGLARAQALRHGAAGLPRLAPICTHLLLTPFLGTEAATELANGDGRTRQSAAQIETIRRLATEPLPPRIITLVADRFLDPASIAAELGEPERTIARELTALEAAGVVESTDAEAPHGPGRLYRSCFRRFTTEEWIQLGQADRARLSARILELIEAEVTAATAEGTFDARSDRHLVHFPAAVDEAGWAELGVIFEGTLEAAQEAIGKATERLEQSGETPINGRAAFMLFESPVTD